MDFNYPNEVDGCYVHNVRAQHKNTTKTCVNACVRAMYAYYNMIGANVT